MTPVEKLFALEVTPPFDRLREDELALIAEIASARIYEPGDIVHHEHTAFNRIHILIKGAWMDDAGRPLPPVLGVESLLLGRVAQSRIVAAPDTGAQCLLIERNHFFTIALECPELMLGLLEAPAPRS